MEHLKQACGGHGFLNISGLSQNHLNMNGFLTAEGDGAVLAQQTARFLFKSLQQVMSGKKVEQKSIAFFNNWQDIQQKKCSDYPDMKEKLLVAFQARCLYTLGNASKILLKSKQQGKDFTTVWNEDVQMDIVNASVHFTDAFQMQCFYEALSDSSVV